MYCKTIKKRKKTAIQSDGHHTHPLHAFWTYWLRLD